MTARVKEISGGLKTIERALAVLEIVATAAVPPSTKDLSTKLGHNISSTYNIVSTLLSSGYLSKDNEGLLRLGAKVAVLTNALERANDYARVLRPYVEHVNRVSGETVYLTRLIGQRVVIQSVLDGNQSLRVTGLESDFSGSEDRRASGKAILAFLSDSDVRGILHSLHPNESEQQAERRVRSLRGELSSVRTAGFAFENEAFEPGICCVAAPYFGADGRVAGSIAVSGPSVRAATLQGPIADEVILAAQRMSIELGGRVVESLDPPLIGGACAGPRGR
ncbi:IclR family transcriptional regulator [Arthrobacter sp. MI7-26]|uniref:IclR family transcriptional regulator n=1 Tax=Arthrobacter sp. MI7-26 TaxID=2993653 RepID=UPI0022492430|nr:IclR family transcriptional regulator [Arthrobacter sp. MI7-26]MCX2748038.1 IclR family transcriptional regulator [Arthrobacter sp. MI7-26]